MQVRIHYSKRDLGELITYVAQIKEPWLIAGDFNEDLNNWECSTSNGLRTWRSRRFQECLDDCGLRDLGRKGADTRGKKVCAMRD